MRILIIVLLKDYITILRMPGVVILIETYLKLDLLILYLYKTIEYD